MRQPTVETGCLQARGSRERRSRGSSCCSLAVRVVEVLPGPPTRAGGHGLTASACAELGLRGGRALPVEVGGEQCFAVWWPRDAGGSELGTRVLDGVVGP